MKYVVYTMDVDWAKEEVIEYALNYFKEANVPVTTFLTHKSEVIQSALKDPKVKLQTGIHPNFFTKSTHGSDFQSVISHCLDFKPTLPYSRSHGLMYSSNIMIELLKQNIFTDFSIVNPLGKPIKPIVFEIFNTTFKRYSFNWEDDMFFYYQNNENFFKLSNLNLDVLILNFHPIHIYLNSLNEAHYTDFKAGSSDKNKGIGTETFLKETLQEVKRGNLKAISLSDYFEMMDNQD